MCDQQCIISANAQQPQPPPKAPTSTASIGATHTEAAVCCHWTVCAVLGQMGCSLHATCCSCSQSKLRSSAGARQPMLRSAAWLPPHLQRCVPVVCLVLGGAVLAKSLSRGQGVVVDDARVLRRKFNTLRAGWCLTCRTGVCATWWPAGTWAGAGWVVAQPTWPGRSTGSSTRQCRRVVSCSCCNAAAAGHLPCSQLAGIRGVC